MPTIISGNRVETGSVKGIPAFRANSSGNLSLPSSGWAKVTNLTIETFDVGSGYDAPNAKFLPSVAGYYQINASVQVNNTSLCGAAIAKNGVLLNGVYTPLPTTTSASLAISDVVYLNGTTDYVELWGSGQGASVVTAGQSTYLSGYLVSAT